ncbi:hypothetical protein A7982_12964 [Minicystis rosea]|nr:hypothetical protein A7982_12964 [Minicystis rosea]
MRLQLAGDTPPPERGVREAEGRRPSIGLRANRAAARAR